MDIQSYLFRAQAFFIFFLTLVISASGINSEFFLALEGTLRPR